MLSRHFEIYFVYIYIYDGNVNGVRWRVGMGVIVFKDRRILIF